MTVEELAKYNGLNGQPAYVAVGSVIYDVTESPLWKEGNHEGAHQAGQDLTLELKSAPHIAAVIERFPAISHLEKQVEKKSSSALKIATAVAVIFALIFVWRLLS